MNKPKLNDYMDNYGVKSFENQRKAFLNYAKDLEKYCGELEEKCKNLEYNQDVLKGTLINMQCKDFEKEVIEEGADEDDEKLHALIEEYEAVITAGIDLYLKGKNN